MLCEYDGIKLWEGVLYESVSVSASRVECAGDSWLGRGGEWENSGFGTSGDTTAASGEGAGEGE